jgi:broad specificity phosphatase PhoE
MTILEKVTWGQEALEVLQATETLNVHTPAMIILRHSHRNDGVSWEEIKKLRLTDEGKQAAFDFGYHLSPLRKYRIYSSQFERCMETAREIEKGILQNHGEVKNCGDLRILGEFLGKSDRIGDLFMRDMNHFINSWAACHYSREDIEPLSEYTQRAASIMWKLHKTGDADTIDIFITHDVSIMALEFGWFGWLRNTFEEWVNFLGGFVMQLEKDRIKLLTRKKTITCHYPHWNPLSKRS